MKHIEKLTEEQKAAMPAYRDKWIEIGLRTGETDFETFDKYMPICYEKANIPYPKNVVRVSSPLVGAVASSIANSVWAKGRGAVDGDDRADDAFIEFQAEGVEVEEQTINAESRAGQDGAGQEKPGIGGEFPYTGNIRGNNVRHLNPVC